MRLNARVVIIGLLLKVAISGLIRIARTRLITITDHNRPEAISVQYHFFGDDSPGVETLKGNPHCATVNSLPEKSEIWLLNCRLISASIGAIKNSDLAFSVAIAVAKGM
jgi:hypothetical protein